MDEPSAGNAAGREAATHADAPSPHAKFPWAPALFCAACLAMAAWTWMRYSYCWDIALRDLPSLPEGVELASTYPLVFNGSFEHFARLPAYPSLHAWPGALGNHWLRDRYVRVKGRVGSCSGEFYVVQNNGMREPGHRNVVVSEGTDELGVYLPPSQEAPHREGDNVVFRGRLILTDWHWATLSDWDSMPLSLDSTAGRWHAASVGGLFVGAMGVLVFALYLRSWLRERTAPKPPPRS
jgi:hypothetical protein